jgi:hypothetical protein
MWASFQSPWFSAFRPEIQAATMSG